MDRQDIDALLIGALYGELTPADEARLAAHLDSHPADRGALDDLKTARQAVRESRIFELQLDPPQAVSALLLQEAHRRAPKRVANAEEKEGWFARFARSFMAHPAMAAAAMLVLVVGVAGTLYVKKGENFAGRQAPMSAAESERAPATVAQTPADEPMVGGAAGSANADEGDQGADRGVADGEGYQAGLYDGNAEATEKSNAVGRTRADQQRQKLAKESGADKWQGEEQKPAPAKKNKGIAVSTEQAQPKELESDRAKDVSGTKTGSSFALDVGERRSPAGAAAPGATRGGGGGGAGAGAGTGAAATGSVAPTAPAATYAQPPPPPAQIASVDDAKTTTPAAKPTTKSAPPKPDPKPSKAEPNKATVAKSPPRPAEPAPAPAPEAKRDESSLVAWAKSQHQRTIALVKDGKCVEAAKLALGVSNRAPDYYAQFMATDRALSACRQYINQERDKDAEKSAKSRTQKRVNADEAAPATNAK